MKHQKPDADDWARFFSASPAGYHLSALQAAWDYGGDEMLSATLKKLKINSVEGLIKLVNGLEKKKSA